MADTVVSTETADSSGYDSMAADLDTMDTSPAEGSEVDATEDIPDAPADIETEAPELEEEQEAEPEPEVAAPVVEETEPLPDGVSVRDRNGNKEFVLKESRYHTVYGGYKAAQAAEEVFGEQLTPELAQSRQQAYASQEAMIADYMSGDANAEGRFLQQLAKWGKSAREIGEIDHSPLRNIAARLPEFLQKTGDNEALNAMATPLIRMRLDQLYNQARDTNNENLFLSLQHIDNAVFGSYKKVDQLLAKSDPLAEREAQIAERERKYQEQHQAAHKQELGRWQEQTGETIKASVSEAIKDSLKPVLPFYEKFPADLQGLQESLRSEFQQTLKKDLAWQTYLENAGRRAANATSNAIREAVAGDLEARYKAKAKYWFDPSRNTKVREILTQRSAAVKASSDAKHSRLAQAGTRREPGSIGTPVARSARTTPNNGAPTLDQWSAAIDNL